MARKLTLAALLFSSALLALASCGTQQPLQLGHDLDAPATYRVGATSTARFSGHVSDKTGETRLTAAFRATPVSEDTVEIEALYVAASVEDAEGEPVALGLGDLSGATARVELGAGGQVARVTGDEELLEAPVPLVSMRAVVEGLFPPLPGEATEPQDTWTGAAPVPFPAIAGPPIETRYVLSRASASGGGVEGYEISSGDYSFDSGDTSGRGRLDHAFTGEYERGAGYEETSTTTSFRSQQLRLGAGNAYANGNVRLEQRTTTERLNAAESFGLGLGE